MKATAGSIYLRHFYENTLLRTQSPAGNTPFRHGSYQLTLKLALNAATMSKNQAYRKRSNER